jgi:hemerythrin-like metal-binding protein
MGKPEDDVARAAGLRQQAERLASHLGGQADETAATGPRDALLSVLHELHVHQIELETQNEELRRVQAELERSRIRYFELYDQAPVGYCTLAGSGLILEANQTALGMLERPLERLVGRPFSSFIHRQDRSLFHSLHNRFLTLGAAFSCDLRLLPQQAPPLWTGLAVKSAAFHDPDQPDPPAMPSGQAWMTLTDLSVRKRAEEDNARLEAQLRHTHRLEAIGRLAGGLAHDFNNLLGAMAGNLDLLRLELPQGPGLARVDSLDRLVVRAGEQVARILTFAGRGGTRMQVLELNRQVEAMAGLLRSTLQAGTDLRLDLGADLPPVMGDPSQIQQVILNLVLNASEALGREGGFITLDTRRVLVTAEDLKASHPGQPPSPGSYLALTVADPGPGMTPEVRSRLFEPYFSTRFAGRGLGLSVVYGVLASHRGGIRVESLEGQGTSVSVLFPALPGPVAEADPAAPAAALPGDGTVLLVEDEEALRTVAAQALRQLGYEPLEAADGVEALQRFETHRGELRLVFMDLTMPNMDGDRAYRELRLAGATLPIVLTSGFAAQEALRPFRGRGVAGFLPKPYRLQELGAALRAALDRPAARDPLPWGRELETGHPAVDAQHRELVQAYNRVLLAVAGGAPGEAGQALARLIDAAIAHFGLEESLMQATGCPNFRHHQTTHARLVVQIQDLAGRIQRGEAGFTAAVLDFLQDWLVCHIQTEDQDMARHLKQSGH